MKTSFGKSVSTAEKVNKLMSIVGPGDSLAILLTADPDALASALALRRLFWRKVQPIHIVCTNRIDRADNLALINLLDIPVSPLQSLKKSEITKWALVDSQPSHNEQFAAINFDIIIDHHPPSKNLNAPFIDIREEYGANATLMTEYLKAAGIKPSPRLATALFYAIKTDTDNFVRPSVSKDMIAFRYLYELANRNIIKKIESSEMTRDTLAWFQQAMQDLVFIDKMALICLGDVKKPDILVQIADFFLKMAEATWSIVSGVYDQRLIVILRNADFRRHAGHLARDLFGEVGSAGGHKDSARAEIPLENIGCGTGKASDCKQYMLRQIRNLYRTEN